jgi:hypothetical protein
MKRCHWELAWLLLIGGMNVRLHRCGRGDGPGAITLGNARVRMLFSNNSFHVVRITSANAESICASLARY